MHYLIKISLCLCALLSGIYVKAQSNSTERLKKASRKVEKGYTKANSDTLAQGYYDLGKEYADKGELKKSEAYYQQAKDLFVKSNDAAGVAKASRALASVQEELGKPGAAEKNYDLAKDKSLESGDKSSALLNQNDVSRLSDKTNNATVLLQSNVEVGLLKGDTAEVIGNYNKMASANIQSEEPQLAIDALSKAYQLSRSNPEKALRINQQIADVYVQQKDFASAIETRQAALNEPFVSGSTLTKSNVITSLAEIYLRNNDKNSAVQLLRQSYELAVNNGHTLAARRSVERLDSIYKSIGETGKSLSLYTDFLRALPGMISKDSSLADSKVIAETEQKLKLMEREKALTENLIKEKSTVNTWLTILLVALAVFVSVVLFMLRKLNIHSKKIALQSLRREMNPHFIFNSLNSINQFIANNNELAANQYLTKFSTLMRSVMENSKDDMVLLSKEIDILRKYLELEKSRFSDKFDFRFEVDESLLSEDEFIPGMLLQPFLENAIWHGLRYKDDKGELNIAFTRNSNRLKVVIEDNGIGIAESKKLKTANQLHHHGRGMSNTKERIKILNELYRHNISCQVEDKLYPMHGVKIVFNLPLLKHTA